MPEQENDVREAKAEQATPENGELRAKLEAELRPQIEAEIKKNYTPKTVAMVLWGTIGALAVVALYEAKMFELVRQIFFK